MGRAKVLSVPKLADSLAGVEVNVVATVTAADFRGLRKPKEATGRQFERRGPL